MLKIMVMGLMVVSIGVCGGIIKKEWKEQVGYKEIRYVGIVDSLDRRYGVEQKRGGTMYHWGYVPISIFPFFCGGLERPGEGWKVIFVGNKMSMVSFVDKAGVEHIQVGVEHHMGLYPTRKVYRMYYWSFNWGTDKWEEERHVIGRASCRERV